MRDPVISIRMPASALEAIEQHRLLHGLTSRSAAIIDAMLAGMEARTPRGDALVEAMRAAVIGAIQDEDTRAELATASAETIRGAWIAVVHAARAPEETYADVIPLHTH